MEKQQALLFLKKAFTLALVFIALGIGLLLTPISKEYAYEQLPESCRENNWQYHRLINDTTPMDLVFIGSSHSMLAVKDSLLQQLLGNNMQVANISFCRLGRDLQHTMLLDMLRTHKPKHVVIEVRKTENRFSHPDHPLLADGNTLLNPTPLVNQAYFGNLLMALQTKAEYWRKVVSRSWQADDNPSALSPYGWKENTHTADANFLKERKAKLHAKPKQMGDERIHQVKYRYAHQWLKRSIDSLQQHGAKVYFLYLPDYGTPLKEPLDANIYRNYGPLLLPPQDILDKPTNWYDHDHLNHQGADTLTKWLAKNISLQ